MNERARNHKQNELAQSISDKPEVQRMLPLSQTCTWILISLAYGPKHGYAIAKEVEELSEGTFEIASGNIPAALRNYDAAGLVKRVYLEESRRKTYHITDFGVEVLEAECKRIDFMLELAKRFKSK